ncbi:YchJ family protein [Streptomyces sp. NPDC087440]|uniref:YchJ family protein n=1 Tax=Streptomyces sp. NPDC087440 TaxID=3365790 RepID=UPI0037FA8FBA
MSKASRSRRSRTQSSRTEPSRPSRPVPAPTDPAAPCPCGRAESYADCCGRFHRGDATAPTAERLMRSRYSAFVVLDVPYLLRTWHPTTRPADLDLDPAMRWTGLDILRAEGGSAFHQEGVVEFRAHYVHDGEADSQHEVSRFVRAEGHWTYLDGQNSGS